MHKLGQRLEVLPHPVVRKPDWQKLEETEQAKADVLKLPEFKFSSNQDMLDAIGLNGRNPA
jgi:hypothetical protein